MALCDIQLVHARLLYGYLVRQVAAVDGHVSAAADNILFILLRPLVHYRPFIVTFFAWATESCCWHFATMASWHVVARLRGLLRDQHAARGVSHFDHRDQGLLQKNFSDQYVLCVQGITLASPGSMSLTMSRQTQPAGILQIPSQIWHTAWQ